MKVNNILVIGNDIKMQECKNCLISEGYRAEILTEDEILSKLKWYDCVILPLPTVSNGYIAGTTIAFEDIINSLNDKQFVFYGNSAPVDYANCRSYYYNESFLIKNSNLTAQGVMRLILENIDYGLYGKKVAVIGYGRCGKAISALLSAVGMAVTVFIRRKDAMTQVYYDGYLSENISVLNDCLNNFDIIVNTVPSNIINETGVKMLSSDKIYIEIASKPYGLNICENDQYNFKYILGKSLPGRFYPKSAGKNIADTVIEFLREV